MYDEVEEELRDSQTVVQIHTPRPATAMAAESIFQNEQADTLESDELSTVEVIESITGILNGHY